ncbi:hypothetical protein HOY80DRAFT_1001600 [Tuber brumale]|nr:hypothetical protein HOY80DRAFT_1001600 [Tuber brumale]
MPRSLFQASTVLCHHILLRPLPYRTIDRQNSGLIKSPLGFAVSKIEFAMSLKHIEKSQITALGGQMTNLESQVNTIKKIIVAACSGIISLLATLETTTTRADEDK